MLAAARNRVAPLRVLPFNRELHLGFPIFYLALLLIVSIASKLAMLFNCTATAKEYARENKKQRLLHGVLHNVNPSFLGNPY